MNWSEVADVLIAIPFVIMFGLCALGMIRGLLRGSDRGGHGMMCMGGRADHGPRGPEDQVVDQLRAERQRLNRRIARAEREAAERLG